VVRREPFVAFPSKSSAYVLAGCQILAICGRDISVARWVEEHGVGVAAEPDKQSIIIATFRQMETDASADDQQAAVATERSSLREKLSFGYFTNRLCGIMGLELAGSSLCARRSHPALEGSRSSETAEVVKSRQQG